MALSEKLLKSMIGGLSHIAPGLAVGWAVRLFTTPRHFERPEWERTIVAQGQSLKLAGLSATAWGADAAPAILLIHGWRGRGSQLSLLAAPLVAAGFRVIALDGPAHGDSAGTRTNVYFFSRALLEIAKQQPLFGVVAHSFGGSAAALALADGWALAGAVLVASPANLGWVIDAFCKWLGFNETLSLRFHRSLAAWAGIPREMTDVARLGAQIHVPVLIVHDPKDREVPFSSAEAIVQGWPSAKLLSLRGVGHRRVLKAPEFLEAVTKFFAELPTRSK